MALPGERLSVNGTGARRCRLPPAPLRMFGPRAGGIACSRIGAKPARLRLNRVLSPCSTLRHSHFTQGRAPAYSRPNPAARTSSIMPNAQVPADRVRIDIIGAFSAVLAGPKTGQASELSSAQRLQFPSRKAQALLGYLILGNVAQVPRQRLMDLLWSASNETHARGSLRHALHEIQKGFRDAGLSHFFADKLNAGIATAHLDLDLWQIMADAKAGKVHSALLTSDRLTDNLLAGLDDVDPVFSEWLQETRAAAHTELATALEKLLPAEDAEVISDDAEIAARALQRLSPGHERSARVLIKARAAANDLGTALQIYTALWKRLENDFDIEPSEATQNLVARIRMEQPETGAAPLTAAASVQRLADMLSGNDARPSIAVLPFRPGSPDVESYFTSGIVDNVIHVLASFKELFVISRSSTLSFRDAAPDLRAIGQTLGVRYILHGTVQRAGHRLRIQTELVDAEKGEVVRTLQHNGAASELFELQDQLAIDVVKSIAPYIRDRELSRAMRKRPQDLTAYDLVLQAIGPLHDVDYTSFSRARGLLQRAIELDPTYASAYAHAAHWYCYRIGQEWSTDLVSDANEAERLATLAIGLDENNASALAAHAHVLCFMRRDYRGSIAGFERALSASPNSAFAWTLSAVTQCCVGDGTTAERHAHTAIRLSPADNLAHFPLISLAQAYFIKRQYTDAVEFGRRAFHSNTNFTATHRILGASLVEVGLLDEARTLVRRHLETVPGFRLGAWLQRTPLSPATREQVARNLRLAGMPE